MNEEYYSVKAHSRCSTCGDADFDDAVLSVVETERRIAEHRTKLLQPPKLFVWKAGCPRIGGDGWYFRLGEGAERKGPFPTEQEAHRVAAWYMREK